MNRFICLHGHFYQPPRENPWLGEIEVQESASPWHDWNERIAEECYGPNSASRLFDEQGWIRRIVNNYSRISFNFGPTLLSWMERKRPVYYGAVLEADRLGAGRFSGHGPAIAQAYNHIIMPLANRRDKITQVLWGMEDFRRRFKREPEGMWLPETAVDSETLDILTEHGVRFVILAPRQAASVRTGLESTWTNVSGERIDTSRPYVCSLPSGRAITVFFYNGPLAQKIAFGDALRNGDDFARTMIASLPTSSGTPRLLSVATDGETFGHHHKYGDMALAYCLDTVERSKEAALTVYGEFLEFYPPMEEVILVENSSWSCAHGVGRWKEDCGCSAHSRPGWNQRWRAPFREAMDGLRDSVIPLFEEESAGLFQDPWGARDRYIDVFFDRSESSPVEFMDREAGRELTGPERTKGLRLMELQLNLMLMYTSCGWFFDDISGIENIQVMAYAARALELCGYLFPAADLKSPFFSLLERAPSNIAELRNGKRVFDIFVVPSVSDLLRAGAHYAFLSLFVCEEGDVRSTLGDSFYSYRITSCSLRRGDKDGCRYALGRLTIRSEVTLDEKELFVAALYCGGRNAIGGVAELEANEMDEDLYGRVESALKEGVESAMVKSFGHNTYSLRHLFKDEQQRIMNMIIAEDVEEVVSSLRRTVADYSELLSFLTDLGMPAPEVLRSAARVVLNDELKHGFEAEFPDIGYIERKISEGARLGVDIDTGFIQHAGMRLLKRLFDSLEKSPADEAILRRIVALLLFFRERGLDVDLWDAQNTFVGIIASIDDLSCYNGQYEVLGDLLRIRCSGVKTDYVNGRPGP